METKPILGVIGGSGLYQMDKLKDPREVIVKTPFGDPSAPIVIGQLNGKMVAFLARHGVGHKFLPGEVNYRANIYAMKKIGVERIVSISACGSLREDYRPGDIIIPDQLYDHTNARERTFFGKGLVAHIGTADPFCNDLSLYLAQSIRKSGGNLHTGGTFITIEGPRFSTRAESNTYRALGMSLVGMTASPEAFLAREAEICYSVMAHVTDYDVWHISEDPVSVEQVITVLNQNLGLVQKALDILVTILPETCTCPCNRALANALITSPQQIPNTTKQKLGLLINKYYR